MDIFSESAYTNNGYAVSISVRKYSDSDIVETLCILNKSNYNVTSQCVNRVKAALGDDIFEIENIPEITSLQSTSSLEIRKYMKEKADILSTIISRAMNFYRNKRIDEMNNMIGG